MDYDELKRRLGESLHNPFNERYQQNLISRSVDTILPAGRVRCLGSFLSAARREGETLVLLLHGRGVKDRRKDSGRERMNEH